MPLRSMSFLNRRSASPIGSLSWTRIRKGIRDPFQATPAPAVVGGGPMPKSVLIAPAAAAPAVAATAAAAAAAPAAAPVGLGAGFVHRERPAVHLLPVEGRDGRLGLVVIGHLHEAEALGATGVPVHDHLCRRHCPVGLEHLPES